LEGNKGAEATWESRFVWRTSPILQYNPPDDSQSGRRSSLSRLGKI